MAKAVKVVWEGGWEREVVVEGSLDWSEKWLNRLCSLPCPDALIDVSRRVYSDPLTRLRPTDRRHHDNRQASYTTHPATVPIDLPFSLSLGPWRALPTGQDPQTTATIPSS